MKKRGEVSITAGGWYPEAVELRSATALKNITHSILEKQDELSYLISSPVDDKMVNFFSKQQEPFSIRKRFVQEQCAHFVLRHFAKNNKMPGDSSIIRIMGLAGQNPILAIASYLRRGLVVEADLFEEDDYIYKLLFPTKVKKEQTLILHEDKLLVTFWTSQNYTKKINIINKNYLEANDDKIYHGFLLDHCGKMPDSKNLAEYVNKKTKNFPFFIEATMLDGRGSVPDSWSRNFEDHLRDRNIFVLAKDSFEYKGGTGNDKYGSPMKTFVWVFEKEKENKESPEKIILES